MPLDFEDPNARTAVVRRVLMLCDRWSDWSGGTAVINHQLAVHLATYPNVDVYRSPVRPLLNSTTRARPDPTRPDQTSIRVKVRRVRLVEFGHYSFQQWGPILESF